MCVPSTTKSDIKAVRPTPSPNDLKAWQVRDPMYAGRREPIGDNRYLPGTGKVNLEWWKSASDEDRQQFYKDQTKRRTEAEAKARLVIKNRQSTK